MRLPTPGLLLLLLLLPVVVRLGLLLLHCLVLLEHLPLLPSVGLDALCDVVRVMLALLRHAWPRPGGTIG